jgi:ornithine carbamoyltransferase
MKPRHFLTLFDLSSTELNHLMNRAALMKANLHSSSYTNLMAGMTMVMLFEKTSTRTRVSFEVAASQFGGHTLFLAPGDSQLSRGEPLSDTARIISSMADLIVMRTSAHDRVMTMAEYSSVPVINAMSDSFHPCQLLADVLTFIEKRGQIQDANVAWIGDGNNVCHSWIHAAHQFGFDLRLACPSGYHPDKAVLEAAKGKVHIAANPHSAVSGCDLVVTDTWFSIGRETQEKEEKIKAFSGYCVTDALLQAAQPDAIFMHCLPAYRGTEVSASVIDGPQSAVWEEAENRLHAQKALIEFLLEKSQ